MSLCQRTFLIYFVSKAKPIHISVNSSCYISSFHPLQAPRGFPGKIEPGALSFPGEKKAGGYGVFLSGKEICLHLGYPCCSPSEKRHRASATKVANRNKTSESPVKYSLPEEDWKRRHQCCLLIKPSVRTFQDALQPSRPAGEIRFAQFGYLGSHLASTPNLPQQPQKGFPPATREDELKTYPQFLYVCLQEQIKKW